MGYRCPTCKRPVKEGEKHFPFCSERCRWVDLGHWLDEDYRVPLPEREDDGLGEEGGVEGPLPRPGGAP